MMTEQQTILKNDELQDRWEEILCEIACLAVNLADIIHKIKEVFETLNTLLQDVATKIAESFSKAIGAMQETFNISISLDVKFKERPKYRPTYRNQIKPDTVGFSKPIICRARSRC